MVAARGESHLLAPDLTPALDRVGIAPASQAWLPPEESPRRAKKLMDSSR